VYCDGNCLVCTDVISTRCAEQNEANIPLREYTLGTILRAPSISFGVFDSEFSLDSGCASPKLFQPHAEKHMKTTAKTDI
jgi:hypothetical protein